MIRLIKRIRIITMAFLCATMPVAAMNQAPQFRHYMMKNGLPSNIVHAIYQDERDFIWMGTDNGVSLFNGTEFRNFQFEFERPNGQKDKRVYEINVDGKGTV